VDIVGRGNTPIDAAIKRIESGETFWRSRPETGVGEVWKPSQLIEYWYKYSEDGTIVRESVTGPSTTHEAALREINQRKGAPTESDKWVQENLIRQVQDMWSNSGERYEIIPPPDPNEYDYSDYPDHDEDSNWIYRVGDTEYDLNPNNITLQIQIYLPADRSEYGSLRVVDQNDLIIYGPVRVLGQADHRLSLANGNAIQDPLLPYGHTPTGEYSGSIRSSYVMTTEGKHFSDILTESGALEYGHNGMIVMSPNSGQAVDAGSNGRSEIFIQAGDMDQDGLKPTAGGLRVSNDDMHNLVSLFMAKEPSILIEGPPVEVNVNFGVPYRDISVSADPPREEANDVNDVGTLWPSSILYEMDWWEYYFAPNNSDRDFSYIQDISTYIHSNHTPESFENITYGEYIGEIGADMADSIIASAKAQGGGPISRPSRPRRTRSSDGRSRGGSSRWDGGGGGRGNADGSCGAGYICYDFGDDPLVID
ncbi:MAG: hypothetical protein AAGG57_12125, partial [Pseudomonadota bacterium]